MKSKQGTKTIIMFKILIFAAAFSIIYAKTITFTDCGSVGGKINSVDLSPCEAEPCQLHRGQNYSTHVNFTANEDSKGAKTVVHGIIAGVPVPFPVPADCCANKNLKCPITKGTTDVYSNYVYCSPEYPKLRLAVKWEVQDDNGKDLFCFVAPLEIVD